MILRCVGFTGLSMLHKLKAPKLQSRDLSDVVGLPGSQVLEPAQ